MQLEYCSFYSLDDIWQWRNGKMHELSFLSSPIVNFSLSERRTACCTFIIVIPFSQLSCSRVLNERQLSLFAHSSLHMIYLPSNLENLTNHPVLCDCAILCDQIHQLSVIIPSTNTMSPTKIIFPVVELILHICSSNMLILVRTLSFCSVASFELINWLKAFYRYWQLLGWLVATPFILGIGYMLFLPCFKILVRKFSTGASSPKKSPHPHSEVRLKVRDIWFKDPRTDAFPGNLVTHFNMLTFFVCITKALLCSVDGRFLFSVASLCNDMNTVLWMQVLSKNLKSWAGSYYSMKLMQAYYSHHCIVVLYVYPTLPSPVVNLWNVKLWNWGAKR